MGQMADRTGGRRAGRVNMPENGPGGHKQKGQENDRQGRELEPSVLVSIVSHLKRGKRDEDQTCKTSFSLATSRYRTG